MIAENRMAFSPISKWSINNSGFIFSIGSETQSTSRIALLARLRNFAAKRQARISLVANGLVQLVLDGDDWLKRARRGQPLGSRSLDRAGYQNWGFLADDGRRIAQAFSNAGIEAPDFERHTAQQAYAGLLHYFSRVVPFLRRGHLDFVATMGRALADQAMEVADGLDFEIRCADRDPAIICTSPRAG
jgi:hypothetical protein